MIILALILYFAGAYYVSWFMKKKYPLCFIIMPLIGLMIAFNLDFSFNSLLILFISLILVIIAIIDEISSDIYLHMIIFLFILCLIYRITNGINMKDIVLSMFSVSGFMLLMMYCVKDSFGFGDIELMFCVGLFLPFINMLIAFFIAVFIAGLKALYLIVFKKGDRKSHMPFGPYLVCGVLLSHFYGMNLFYLYLSLIF